MIGKFFKFVLIFFILLVLFVFLVGTFYPTKKHNPNASKTISMNGVLYEIPGRYGFVMGIVVEQDRELVSMLRTARPNLEAFVDGKDANGTAIYITAQSTAKSTSMKYRWGVWKPEKYSTMKHHGKEFGLDHYVNEGPLGQFEEIYAASPPETFFVTCNRVIPPETIVQNLTCNAYFSADDLMFTVWFPRDFMSDWKKIKELSIARMESFRVQKSN